MHFDRVANLLLELLNKIQRLNIEQGKHQQSFYAG